MKKQRILIYTLLVLAASVLDACFESPGTDLLLNNAGASQVEIQEAGTSSGLEVVKAYQRDNDGKPKKDSIRINLVGPQRSTPINVSFTIDPTSTAVAGFHYTMVTTGGAVVIPANASYAYIKYNVIADNLNLTDPQWKLKFKLATSDVTISPNYGVFTRLIVVACPSNIDVSASANPAGNYQASQSDDFAWFGDPGPPHPTTKVVTISRVSGTNNRYRISDVSAGGYAYCCGSFGYLPDQPALFEDRCGAMVTVTGAGAQIQTGPGLANGTWNPTTKTLVLHYNDAFNNTNGAGIDLFSTFVKIP